MKYYKASEAAKLLNISVRTLGRLEERGQLIPERRNKLRYYSKESLDSYCGIKYDNISSKKKVIAYCRVSSNSQKKELENQLKYMESFIINSGRTVDEIIKDIGSGINYKRKGFLKLIDMILADEVSEIVITYKDRLVRFGYELVEHICKIHGVKITIINLPSTSPQEDLVEDLMTIIHVFSARLYGLRSYSKTLKKELTSDENNTNKNS